MVSPFRTASLILLLLAASAAAQPGWPRPDGGPPPEFSTFVSDVRARPTDAKSVNARFRQLMAALRFGRVRPTERIRREIDELRRLLVSGNLTRAARLLDQTVIGAQALPVAFSAPSASGAPEFASQSPALLSAPPAALPAAPLRGAAEDAAAFSRSTSAPAPEDASWRLFAALAGGAVLLVVGLLVAEARSSGTAAKRSVPRRPLAPPSPAEAPAKTLNAKYALGRPIASGGMGEVYEGRDLVLGRRVAIKRMLPEIQVDAGLRALFLKEARVVAKLSHPYIVPIHDCLESDGDLYLVFEYVEGETLSQLLAREARLPLKECRRILRYVGEAVEHAHKNHVLHRDLKPANIMLDTAGIARVMDFGIALESTRTAASAGPGVLDASGTLRYMPPEQHYGKSVRASDIYAMGVCLYEMATGHPPFAAGTVEELIEAKRARRYPAPSSLRAELPTEFDLFVAAALEPDARNRVSSAPEFLEMLDAVPPRNA